MQRRSMSKIESGVSQFGVSKRCLKKEVKDWTPLHSVPLFSFRASSMGCPSLPSLVAMWLSISTASAAFFLPTTTVLLPSRSVRHRARACVLAQADAPTEVPPQSVFATLDYDAEFVPWDIGEAQPQVRNAARDGAFGSAGTTVLDCGCGAGDNANWLAARGHTMSKARPILPASAAQPADRPRLAEALGNLRHALPLKQASREPAQLAEGGASLFSTCR